ncbi:4'-phosphopantetheinyl transferase family protein [Geodermatophilus sabuli]|uniref:4'-phosphopantetheinyl transferase n=1 Tax=Geodermatophilus sabuli TaxID=1564158 RepID=A0A285E7Z3_9ACTN|nr:4'-phosphopantetheinyl transferase superfamily protein [Geodermatophilus sabuli]MBB3081879.1 4'-phosphopantetheinyl transferase [Geodermatophilus sabuli]SNX95248.1 4'-phosphopantetheinyl transferase [Geodermatophilus sabuli]
MTGMDARHLAELTAGCPGGRIPPLVPGVGQVWWARLDDARPSHDALLSPADLERRARFTQPVDRQRCTVAAAVVRVVLGAHTGRHPASLEIDRSCPRCGGQDGKPRLLAAPDLHFSVSHSGRWVTVAVVQERAVGVDVEQLGRVDAAELAWVADWILAPEERAELAWLPAARRADAFTTYWTRKEAVVKATGAGIGVPLHRLVVSPPSSPARVLRWDGVREQLTLHELRPPRGFAGALAVVGDAPIELHEWDAGPVLQEL